MIRLIKPYISYEDVEQEVKQVFESGIFTKGEYAKLFPEELKKYTGAKHAFLTTSATTALTMCLKLLEIGNGDEVLVSDFSFPATANVVEDIGARPVFVDVRLDTFNMQPNELERKISKKTKALIFVDAFGNPSGLMDIKKVCQRNNITLIEDAACAIGSSIEGVKVGNIADLTCFSFHPRKLLTTGEGGAILTNNDIYAEKLSVKLNHGAKDFDFIDYGYNYRLSELQCIMGITQLKILDDIIIDRNSIQKKYEKELSKIGFRPQQSDDKVIHNMQSVVFENIGNIDIKRLISELRVHGIEATIGTYSLSNCIYYRNKYNDVQKNSKYLFENTITLPCYKDIDIDRVISEIKGILE